MPDVRARPLPGGVDVAVGVDIGVPRVSAGLKVGREASDGATAAPEPGLAVLANRVAALDRVGGVVGVPAVKTGRVSGRMRVGISPGASSRGR